MNETIRTIMRITEREWSGKSLMGRPFLPLVKDLPLEVLRDNATYEGFSIWDIALHVLYHKWAMLPVMGGDARPELYPYEQGDWPRAPENKDAAAWDRLVSLLEKTHLAYMKTLGEVSDSMLGQAIPAWNCTMADALESMSTHDLYHAVQIRNMGLRRLPQA